jgi:hypothetical protein
MSLVFDLHFVKQNYIFKSNIKQTWRIPKTN